MTQQKSERGVVSQRRRKTMPTPSASSEGEKAAPVKQQSKQLLLFGETAETPSALKAQGTDDQADRRPRLSATSAVPKSPNKEENVSMVAITRVIEQLEQAFSKVAANRGASGPDRMSIETVRKHWSDIYLKLCSQLADGSYTPGEIRRVWIPKAGGGERGLGIPNVVDRVVQEALRAVLEPLYEPTFHNGSHGFRPNRSCQTAIAQAKQYVEDGYEYVVDLDLEKFFDRVPHQRLMAKLSLAIKDRAVLILIGKMLRSRVVMPDGVVVSNDEGVPQGGPLSPLLSNIVLHELDQELEQRGHKFVRYADDCNIYVRTERAGHRVMASIVRFIERRMGLKVNEAKSAVARPEGRHFLGFRMWREPLEGSVQVHVSQRTKERLRARIREETPRNYGGSLQACITKVNVYLRGWMNFFGLCTDKIRILLKNIDAHIRRRLRAVIIHDWKRKRTIVRKLIALGVKPKTAWGGVYGGRKSAWALSTTSAIERGLRNAYFAARGLLSLEQLWEQDPRRIAALTQLRFELG